MDNDSKSTIVSGLESLGVAIVFVIVVVIIHAVISAIIKFIFRCTERISNSVSTLIMISGIAFFVLYITRTSNIELPTLTTSPVTQEHPHSIHHVSRKIVKKFKAKHVKAKSNKKLTSSLNSNNPYNLPPINFN